MRFGKRLAAATQKSRANAPYISYKELKSIVSRVAALCGSKDGPENSSGDEGYPTDGTWQLSKDRLEESTSASSSLRAGNLHPKVVAPQEEFFQLVGSDIATAKLFVQSTVSGLEAMLGEWQVAAIKAGLLFTPEQLAEIASQLPVKVGEEAVKDWLRSLPPRGKTKEARRALVEKHSKIAQVLNSLLQYIEVNLTAIRKIFKKFEKKVPAEFRVRQVLDYDVHHDMFTPSLQHVLVTAVQMQRLIVNTVATQLGLSEEAMGVPISEVGPETLALLSWLRGPAGVDDLLVAGPALQIDVYAKPAGSANVSGTMASAPGTAPAASVATTASGSAVEAAAGFVTTVAPAGAPKQAQQLHAGLVPWPVSGAAAIGSSAALGEEDDGGEEDAAAGNAAPHKPRRRGGRNNRKRISASQQGHQQGQPSQQAQQGHQQVHQQGHQQVQPQQAQQPSSKVQQHVQQQARPKANSKAHHRNQLEAAQVALAAGLVTPQTTAAAAAAAAAASSAASDSATKAAPSPGSGGGAGGHRQQPPAKSPMDQLTQPQLLLLQQQMQQFQQQQQPGLLQLQQHLQQQFLQQLELQQCLGQLQCNYGGKAAGKGQQLQ